MSLPVLLTPRLGPRDAPPLPALRAYLRRAAQLARVMAPHAAIVALFLSFLTLTKVYSVIAPELPFWSVMVPVGIAGCSIGTVFLYAGMVLGGAFDLVGWKHALALTFGVAASMWVCSWPILQLTGYPWDAALRWHIVESQESWDANGLWTSAATGLLLVVFYSMRDREASIARASREADVERALAQRAVVESRLQVLQARVEPEFLFDALADARRLYENSPPAADQLLDDLIVYLRAALPQMRGEASTLGRETALAAAYLKLIPAVREGRVDVETRVRDGVGNLPFPPMVLLPLAQVAGSMGGRRTVIEAQLDGGDILVAVRVQAGVPPPSFDEKLAALRGTLAHFYGDLAQVGTRLHDGDWLVEVRAPAPPPLAPAAGDQPNKSQGNGSGPARRRDGERSV